MAAAPPPSQDPATIGRAFADICLPTGFSPDAVEAAFRKHGWEGRLLRHPTPAAPFATWSFSFGLVAVGHRVIEGAGLKISSCSLILTGDPPAVPALAKSLEVRIVPARFREVKTVGKVFALQAKLKDLDDEQAIVTIRGDRVPFAHRGSVELGPGILIDYSYAKGAYARRLMEH